MSDDDAAWEWLANSDVAEYYPLTGYVMLGLMEFSEPADSYGFMLGTSLEGQEFGSAAVRFEAF